MPTRASVNASIDSQIAPQVWTAKHRQVNKEMLDYVDQQDNPLAVTLAGAAPTWNFAANPVAEITLSGLTNITTFGTTPGKHRGFLIVNNPGTHILKINTQTVMIRPGGLTRVQIFHTLTGAFYFSADLVDAMGGRTLQEVTDEGSETTNAIKISQSEGADGLTLHDDSGVTADGTGVQITGSNLFPDQPLARIHAKPMNTGSQLNIQTSKSGAAGALSTRLSFDDNGYGSFGEGIAVPHSDITGRVSIAVGDSMAIGSIPSAAAFVTPGAAGDGFVRMAPGKSFWFGNSATGAPIAQVKNDLFKMHIAMGLANLATDPATASNGDKYYNTASHKVRTYVNGAWQNDSTDNSVGNLLQTGRVIYVDKNNPNATDTRTGLSKYSLTAPFLTIQAAVNAFTQAGESPDLRDVVVVRAGEYTENVLVTQYRFTIILDNVVLNGGTGNAIYFQGPGYGWANMYLINSTITNTGTTAGDDPTISTYAAVRATNLTDIRIYGNSQATCILSSTHSTGYAPSAVSNADAQNITFSSTNFEGFHATYGGSLANNFRFFSCTFNGGAYASRIFADQCTFVGGSKTVGGRTYAARAYHYFIKNCDFTNTGGYAIWVDGWQYNWNQLEFFNCDIIARDGLAWMSSGVGPLDYIFSFAQNRINITTGAKLLETEEGALQYDNGWIGTGSQFKFTNTISTVPLFTTTQRARYFGTYIKESNTNTTSTIFYGINTGFGEVNPAANVHVKGTAIFDIPTGSLAAGDKVMALDATTKAGKLVNASAVVSDLGMMKSVNFISTSGTPASDGHFYACTTELGNVAITLTGGSTPTGKIYIFKKYSTDSNTLTVQPASSQLIDGSASAVTIPANGVLRLVYIGGGWLTW